MLTSARARSTVMEMAHLNTTLRDRAAALVAEADRLLHPNERAHKLTEAGDLYREAASVVQASEFYFEAVRVHPENPNLALSRLARLARETGDVAVTANLIGGLSQAGHWNDVVTVLTRQADGVSDPDERAGLLIEASRLCADRLNDFGRARTYLLAAAKHVGPARREVISERLLTHLKSSPADDVVAVECARLLTEAGRAKAAVEVLVRSARSAPERARKAALLFDAAILCADRTQQPVEALVYFYEALTHEPDMAHQVQARLDAIQTRWLHLPRVADTLEGIYARMHAPDRVFEVMEARLDFATPAERPTLLLQLAEHAEYQMLEAERAFMLYRQGLEEGAGDLNAFAAGMRRVGAEGVINANGVMLSLFSRLGRWTDLVTVLDDEAQLQADDAERAALHFRAGEILQTHLDDLGGAMQRYVKAFQLQPDNPRYLAAGERLYRRRKDWRMVDRLLGLQVQIAREADQCQRMLVEQARVRHRKLHDPLGAYHALRRALDEGTIEPAMTALSELIRDDQAFAAIANGMRAEAAEEPPAEAARILLELASLEIEVREAADAAIVTMSEASRLVPDDLSCFARVDSLIETHADDVARARWLAEAADRPFPDDARLEWLLEAGQLFEDAGQPAPARDVRTAALTLDPQSADLFSDTVRVAQTAREPGPLANLLGRALNGEIGPPDPPPNRRRAWLHLLANARAEVGDLSGAAECWQTILANDPLDDTALRALRYRLSAEQHWDLLRSVLDGVVEVHVDRGEPAPPELLTELADLAEFRLEDPRLAVVYARQLLTDAPEDETHRARLNRLYTALGDREGQIGLLELDLVSAPTEERPVLAERLVTLATVDPVLHGPRRRGLQALAELAPDDISRWARLADALREDGSAEARGVLAGVLARVWALDPRPERVDVLRELARGQAETGDQVRAWQAVLDVLPDDVEAFDTLHRIHTLAGDDPAAIALLMRRRARTEDVEQRRTWLREAALVAEVRMGDLPRARDLWIEALGPDETDPEALDELVRLAVEASDAQGTLRYGRRRLDQLDGADRIELARRLARTVQSAPEAAEGLELDANTEARRLWTMVYDADPRAVDALEGLCDLAAARGDTDRMLWALDALVPVLDGPALRRVQQRRAEAFTEAGDLGAAVDAWEAVRTLAPDERGPLTAIRQLSLQREDQWSAAQALRAELQFVRDGDESVRLHRELARLSDALGDAPTALEAWEIVLGMRPDDLEALGALKLAYADLGRVDDLVRVLRRLLDLAPDDAARVVQLTEAAELLERLRGDPTEAFDCWRRAFLLATEDQAGMLAQMRRLAEAGGLWKRYSDVLDLARRSPLKAPEDAAIMVEQAHVAEVHLQAPDKAWMLARAAFERHPVDGPALALLCRLGEGRNAWDEVVTARMRATERGCEKARRAELFFESAEITERELGQPRDAFELFARALGSGAKRAEPSLVRLAGEHDLWDRLIEIVKSRWKGRRKTGPRVEALLRLAGLLESKAHDWERAFEQVMLAMQLDPRHPRARAMAWRLAEANDAWRIVGRVFELKAEETEEAWIKAALLRDLAVVQAQHLDQPDRAWGTLKRAFGVRPWDDETNAALEALAEQTNGWGTLAGFYEEEAAWAEARESRLKLYARAAEIHRAHGNPAEGARILQRITDLDPDDLDTVDAALTLRRAAGDAAELAAALEGYLRASEDAERQAEMLTELGELYAGPLDAPTRAEAAWKRLLALRPDDDAVFGQLISSFEGRGAWRELADALEARQARATDPVERQALITERIEVLWTRLGRLKEAFALEAELAEANPTDVERVFALAERADAAKGHAALLACAERSLKGCTPDHAPRLLTLIGRTARDHFGNLTRALETLGRALEIAPDVELAREVAELLKTRRRYGDLVAIYRQYGPALLASNDAPTITPALRAEWALTLAGLEADQLYHVPEAIQTLRALVQDQPEAIDAWERLRALALRQKDGDTLADAVIGLADASAPGLTLSLLETGARDVARQGAIDRAVDLYKRVLALAPDRQSALDALDALASKRRDADLRAETLQRRATNARRVKEKVDVYLELGALHRDARGDAPAARAAFEAALDADKRQIDAMLALVPLLRDASDDAALDTLTDRLFEVWSKAKADATRRQIAEPVADLLLRRAQQAADSGRGDAVLEWLGQAFEVAPTHGAVGQRYADALFQRGDLPAAATVYAQLPDPSADDPEAKAIEHLRRASAFAASNDLRAAMRQYEGATHHPLTRMAALTAMAGLQAQAGRWEAAIRIHLRLADAAADHHARHAAWITAGRLARTHLHKTGRALTLYRRALEDGLRDPMLLREALDLFHAAQRVDDGLEASARLLADTKDPGVRAELLSIRAQLLKRAQRPADALAVWRDAVALAPLSVASAAALLNHLDDADAEEQAWILDRVEAATGLATDDALPVRRQLARIYETRGDTQAAVAAYTRLLDADPDDASAQRALAGLTRRQLTHAPEDAGLQSAAIEHQLALIRQTPDDVNALRALAELYDMAGTGAARLAPLTVLDWLKVANGAEQGELEALRSAPVVLPSLADRKRLRGVARDVWSQPAGTLLKAMYDWLGSDLDALFGGAPDDDPKGASPLDAAVAAWWQAITEALGLETPRLLAVPGNRPAGLWQVEPLTLVIGRERLDAPPRQLAFTLARAAELARGPAILAHYAPETEARALFAAAVALGDSADATADFEADPELLAEWHAFLKDHLGERQRETLARLAANVVASGMSAFEDWAIAVRQTALRAGFVLCGDLGAAVDALWSQTEALRNIRLDSADRLTVMLERAPAIADVLDYAFSPRYHALQALLRDAVDAAADDGAR